VATAAIENPRHDPAPVHDGSTDAARQQPSGFKLLRAVTRLVNGNIRQRTDMEVYGVGEYWNRPTLPGAGDCEDIAIEKRMVLVADGFDPSKLAYAVVYRHDIGLHVVLIARMDEGDYVLDSLSSKVRRWSAAPYKWLRMQTPGNPSAWTTVGAAGA
jgi:predicted transglutaminase-like cysteine proteinase